MPTVQFNATTYSWVTNRYEEGHPIRKSVASKGMMDPVELSEIQLKALAYDMDQVRGDTHFANGKMRVKSAIRELE